MREVCGAAAEYLGCRTLPDEWETGGQESTFEGSFLKVFGFGTSELEQKHVYRPSA